MLQVQGQQCQAELSMMDFLILLANEHLDWTADQGAININAGNYTNTTYSAGDFAS